MSEALHPAAPHSLPPFITAPGETDVWLVVMIFTLIAAVLGIGVLYFKLHALPEHLAHKGEKAQFQLVAVLTLIALFTHNHLFWIAALILALIRIPDFSGPVTSIAASLERIADSKQGSSRGKASTRARSTGKVDKPVTEPTAKDAADA